MDKETEELAKIFENLLTQGAIEWRPESWARALLSHGYTRTPSPDKHGGMDRADRYLLSKEILWIVTNGKNPTGEQQEIINEAAQTPKRHAVCLAATPRSQGPVHKSKEPYSPLRLRAGRQVLYTGLPARQKWLD